MIARPTKAKAIERLRRALEAIPELKQLGFDAPRFKKWLRDTETAINHTFVEDFTHIEDFKKVDYLGAARFVLVDSDRENQEAYLSGLDDATAVLESMIDEVEEYWDDESPRSGSSSTKRVAPPLTNEIFVIHGRDNEAKQMIARFLEKIDLKPVVLHEHPDGGRTIIEKFEQNAEVGYAVVLLTPDDVGSLRGEEDDLNPRARQNAIFEFGYFIGRLGRQRVCALKQGNVEIPSDYRGVLYIDLDRAGGWKMKLIAELQNAGLGVDANKAVSA